MTSSNAIKNLLLSSVGVLIMLAIVVAANVLSYHSSVGADLTEEKLFTLADGTRNILGSLPGTVTIRYYYTRDLDNDPDMVQIANFARQVQDLLEEYEKAGKGAVRLEIYNPSPDTESESAAIADRIRAIPQAGGERFYLGLTVSYQAKTMIIPVITQANQMRLEYDLSRMIVNVTQTERPKVGLMSSFDLFGNSPENPMTMLGKAEEWGIVRELRRENDVVQVPLNATVIPSEIKVLVVIHPKAITPASLYAIDQYLLNGGNLIAFVDPVCAWDAYKDPTAKFNQKPQGQSSLTPLFETWGVGFDPTKVVADHSRKYTGISTPDLTVLNLIRDDVSQDDVVTAGLNIIFVPRAGAFLGTPIEGLTMTPLIHSSANSMMVESSRLILGVNPRVISEEFRSDDTTKAIAVRLAGIFPTAFPDGPPPMDAPAVPLGAPVPMPQPTPPREIPMPGAPAPASPDDADDADPMDDAIKDTEDEARVQGEFDNIDTEDALTKMEWAGNQRMVSIRPASVILVGDADMLDDDFWIQRADNAGTTRLISHNAVFLLNAVSQLSGSGDLISIRSKGIDRRPFTEIAKLQQRVEEELRQRQAELEYEKQQTLLKIGEVQVVQDGDSTVTVLTPAQQADLDRLQEKFKEIQEREREIKKEQKRDINRIENTLQSLNIALIPFLIVHFGLILLVLRRGREQSR